MYVVGKYSFELFTAGLSHEFIAEVGCMLLTATVAYFLLVEERYLLQYYVQWNSDFSNLQERKMMV